MKIMERKYICKNGVVERTRYAVGDRAVPRSGRRKGNTGFRKQEQNFNLALRKVARILNCNYSRSDGLLLTLDYDREGMEKLLGKLSEDEKEIIESLQLEKGEVGSWQSGNRKKPTEGPEEIAEDTEKALLSLWSAADHEMSLWMRRIKRKSSGEIKTLAVTSDVDHETGELVRVHHHIVLKAEGISWDLLQQEWKNGGVDIRRLRAQPDYTPIAVYLMRQVRKQPEKKKYRVSQGMEQPVTKEREVLCHAEIKAPAGANVFERSEYSADCVGQYIRYVPRTKRPLQKGGGNGEIPKNQQHRP